ncbi:MAG TPA: inositol monophosphatase family protein, partial [Labilithrix sp.]
MKRAELEPLSAAVLGIAREAGDLVRAGFRKRVAVEHKRSKTDLVTEYDRASEALVRARLAAASPHAIVGEEQGGNWDPSVPTFFLDPIDGTTNFVHGHPFWCVSIGLVEDGLPVLGVVVAPALGLECLGFVADDGSRVAMRQSEPCIPSTASRIEEAYLATGFPYDRISDPDNNFLEFTSIKPKCQAVRRCG